MIDGTFEAIRSFFKMEAAGGIVLVLAAALAVWVANSPLDVYYQAFLDLQAQVRIGTLDIAKPLILWINDGLMAIFFFLVGLEIKREFVEGELSNREQALLPAIAALGGMIVPAAIYAGINLENAEQLNGWAIPAATDIAFALGVLTLLRSRVPLGLKILLTAIAVLDDLGAIVVIAIFYSENLSINALIMAGIALAVLLAMNLLRVGRIAPYIIVGIVLWVCVLKSGVHATLAGVVLALTIPVRDARNPDVSPLKHLEHSLHSWVAFGVLPIFGFANAGVSFAGIGWSSFIEPVTLGIMLGLFFGKQIGIFFSIRLATRTGIVRIPEGVSWMQIYGLSLLCGIGFTMSLFIGGLAWEHTHYEAAVRLGVMTASILSAVCGALVLVVAPSGKPSLQPVSTSPSTEKSHGCH